MTKALSLLAALVVTTVASQAAVIYTQDFESAPSANTLPGWTRFGGFGDQSVVVDSAPSPTANGTKVGFIDTFTGLASGTLGDTGVAYNSGLVYTMTFDLYKVDTNGSANSYAGTSTAELLVRTVGGSEAVIGSASWTGGTNVLGAIVNSTTTSTLSGNLFLRFSSGEPTNVGINNYRQVEFDNISVSAVPEPMTMTVLGLGALLAAARRRNRKN